MEDQDGLSSPPMAPHHQSWRQRHHTLLQALLARGPLAEPHFHAVFVAVSGGRDPATHQQLFNDTLLKINKDLAFLQFELRACMNQYDGMVYYGVVNNIADEESKFGTKYSVPQIAFYKGLLEAVVQGAGTGSDGSISSIDALNVRLDNQTVSKVQIDTGGPFTPSVGDSLTMSPKVALFLVMIIDGGSQDSQSRLPTCIKNFTLSQKEKTLDELIRDRWLSRTSTGKIGLGIRSFLDLRSWFRGNDIPSCVVCNEASIKAGVKIHEYCLKKKFSQRKASSTACPGCGTEWPCQDGEAGNGDDDVNGPAGEDQATPASRSSRKRRNKRVKAELVEQNDNGGAKAVETACLHELRGQPGLLPKRRKK
ncbi:hypothetical protein U9M48_034722 [Paspalum notatum var. saurae]|uniref:Non-structural maintenance of chromosomes element 1 homolog n=1 Tax=Paspalum notatum var. saurae TaxID=547442 RepID=A0AAQ3UB08_PASNO